MQNFPSRFGPRFLENGRVEYRLWAPSVDAVQLEAEGVPALPMNAQGDGWFAITATSAPGTRYRFGIGDGRSVPDPASRFQPDGVNGYSELIDPARYVWTQTQWRGRPWHEAVIYELHVGAFGGFDGVRAQLPRLASLGVTAIELMPVAAFPGARNWGYDGVFPYAPASSYGHPDALKALIDAAHAVNLMVYLDVVYNHFGPQGNHLAAYAAEFFRQDIDTPWGAAVDLRVPQVRQFFTQNALYWLEEFRFDGLRFDAVHALHDPTFVAELGAAIRQRFREALRGYPAGNRGHGPLLQDQASAGAGHARDEPAQSVLGSSRHVHLMLENEHNDAALLEETFDAQWNDDAHNSLHVVLTGESEGYYANYVEQPIAKLARCLTEGFAFQDDPYPGYAGRPRGTPSEHLPPSRFIFFLQNHDQVGNRAMGERLGVLCDVHALRAAITLQLLCPQTPLLFMGEEWGSHTPFLFFTDYHDDLAEAVRIGRRREFAHFTAFADAATRAQIPDPNALSTFTRSIPDVEGVDLSAHADTLAFYRRLLSLRREHLWPRLKGTHPRRATVLSAQALIANWRLGDGSKLRIAANFGDRPVEIPRTSSTLMFESNGGCAASIARGRLPGRCACVFISEPVP